MVEPVICNCADRPLKPALYVLVLAAAVLSACGQSDTGKEPAPDKGQTIARVNGQEITEHELEAELKELGPIEPEERPAMAREVLRRMVQRAVLAQKAEEAKMHRTPQVMMEMRRNRAETLARAYLENGLARQLPISKYDVEDFVDQNPHYFERRKHYIFDQLVIDNDQMSDEVRDAIRGLVTLEEVQAALTDMNVMFSRRLNANLSSQFPRDAVVKLDTLEAGEIFLTETKEQVIVSKLVESRLQPVLEEEAREVTRRLLTTHRDAAASRRIIDGLVANAKIEFLGSFADTQIFASEPDTDPTLEDSADGDDPALEVGGDEAEGGDGRERERAAQ